MIKPQMMLLLVCLASACQHVSNSPQLHFKAPPKPAKLAYKFQIPEAGMLANFATKQIESRRFHSSTGEGPFSESHGYEEHLQYSDTVLTYSRQITVKKPQKAANDQTLLEVGINEYHQFLSALGGKTLMREKIDFLGCPAYRIKTFIQGIPNSGMVQYYESSILFVRNGYLIELTVHRARQLVAEWEGDEFFDTVSLATPSPQTASIPEPGQHLGDMDLVPCTFEGGDITVFFPGAPAVHTIEQEASSITTSRLDARNDPGAVIYYGLEFIHPGKPGADPSSLLTAPFKTSDEQIMLQKKETFQGNPAIHIKKTLKALDPEGFYVVCNMEGYLVSYKDRFAYLYVYARQEDPIDLSRIPFFKACSFKG